MMYCWRGALMHTIFILCQPTYFTTRYLCNSEYFDSLSATWLAIAAASWIYIVTQVSIPFFRSPLHRVPSPPGDTFPIGHLNFNGGKPPTDNIARMFSTPNDGLLVLWGPLYLTKQVLPTRVDTLLELLNHHNYDWEKPPLSKKVLGRILGDGLVIVEGNKHKAMRKVVAPAFSGRHIRDLVPLFYAKGLAFADSMARQIRQSTGGSLEIMAQMSRVTLDIIGAAGMGKDFNTIDNDKDPLARLYEKIITFDRNPLWLFLPINLLFPPWAVQLMIGTKYARLEKAQTQLRRDVRDLMEEKKQMMLEKSEHSKDIISIIVRSGDFSDEYLVDQLLTFLAAGHETTATALTWTIWLLCLNPRVQDRLRAECNTHLAGKSESEIDASIFDTDTTPYLAAVCNESLRLYPTVPAIARHAVRPTMIGKQHIPKGTSGLVSLWAINRDHSIWGDNAEEYDPERWLKGPNAANGGAENPSAFTTFIHGPRSCIGQSFARTEMKCLLAAMIMRFRFEMVNPDEKIEAAGFVTIKPKGGLHVKLYDLKTPSQEKAEADT